MKHMYIMVGLPGSGKSTEANRILSEKYVTWEYCSADGFTWRYCSADGYFMRAGKYCFDARKLGEAHASCMRTAVEACVARKNAVIIDNTNLTNVERAPYYLLAQAYGYEVTFVLVGSVLNTLLYAERNVHGVPLDALQRMAMRMEYPLPFWTFNTKVVL